MVDEESSVEQAKLQIAYIIERVRLMGLNLIGAFFFLCALLGFFASCSLSVGWYAGQAISKGVGISG
jgi:hypothetical protein